MGMNRLHYKTPHLIINATQVVSDNCAEIYEFLLDENLNVIECTYIPSLSHHKQCPVKAFTETLQGDLFELNHIRVNPMLDNDQLLDSVRSAIEQSGVEIHDAPESDAMALCFKPLGELSDIVRFYVRPDASLVFLSQAVKLKMAVSQHASLT